MGLATEVLKASEANAKGAKYMAPNKLATETIKFLSAIFDGCASLSMIVTLSSATQNGWETWFSLQYGTDLSKLRVPLRSQPVHNLDKLYKDSQATATKFAKEFEKAAINKYCQGRKARMEEAA